MRDAAPLPEAVAALAAEIDLSDAGSVLLFGSGLREDLAQRAQQMLRGLSTKDTGPARDAMQAMLGTLSGFSVSPADGRKRRTFWEWLFWRPSPYTRFLRRLEAMQGEIDAIADRLLRHEQVLMLDIEDLDALAGTMAALQAELDLYLAAATVKRTEVEETLIPAAEARLAQVPDAEKALRAQGLNDLQQARDTLERQIHDLQLTRQVAEQQVAGLRIVQENDRALVARIGQVLEETLPLWQAQLAQALSMQQTVDALGAARVAAQDSAAALTEGKAAVETAQADRSAAGSFDPAAIRAANAVLVDAVTASLQSVEDGNAKRAQSEATLREAEDRLRASAEGR